MDLSQAEALAFLNTLKGSFVFTTVRVNLAPLDDPSLGVVRLDSGAKLESCDADGVSLTWSNGGMFALKVHRSGSRIRNKRRCMVWKSFWLKE